MEIIEKDCQINLYNGKSMVSHILYSINHKNKEVFLGELHTKQRFRKKGYATFLMNYFVEKMNSLKGYKIRLTCVPFYHHTFDKRNNELISLDNLIAFYKKYGFEPCGTYGAGIVMNKKI